MMTEHDDPTLDRLKHHFAQRVINQARQVLEVWQRLTRAEWNSDGMEELADATLRLQRYAERFEQAEHAQLAGAIDRTLDVVEANRGRLSSESISELNQLMQRLSRTGLRHGDQLEHTVLPPLRKPVYLALKDRERAERLAQQLEFFGLQALSCETADAFRASMRERYPAAIVMEVDFAGPDMGLRLASEAQAGLEHKLPVLFFSDSETDTPTRLAAARAGGQEFFTGTLDASSVLEKIETLSRLSFYEPYRVLIVDDSRAQALHTEMVLNSAGIITRALTEPLSVMAELSDFQPDLIILDMYMPECLGTELAKVIRQHERHVSVPIIYLSAEDDLDKQLDAMSEGGDDFLTKPIRPRHLIATVRTRASRARSLKARMVRDSLTGLYNHTHTLQLLEDARLRASRWPSAELRDARHRPLQAGQRPFRPPHGRPGDQGPGAVSQAAPSQDRPHRPLWRRGVRRGPSGHRSGRRAPGARRDSPALRRDPLPGATDRPALHLQLRHRRADPGPRYQEHGQAGRRSAVPGQARRTQPDRGISSRRPVMALCHHPVTKRK